ncbi:MAG: TIGR03936 family radical SAM-associated protein [Anaerolineae bacterium]
MKVDDPPTRAYEGPSQRLRIQFVKGEPLKYISHLDLARTWERIFRRAGLPLAYSHGFNPRPRFQIAAGLPVGVIGRAELLDVWLIERLPPEEVLSRLQPVLPLGLEVLGVMEIDRQVPSLQSQLHAADYQAVVYSQEPIEAIQARIQGLLESPTLFRRRQHKGRWQTYNLRPLIQSVSVEPGTHGEQIIKMRLQTSPQGAGRPDEVLDALGLSLAFHRLERTNLCFEFDK